MRMYIASVSGMDDLPPAASSAERSPAERIRDAALASFAAKGIGATSVRHVAEAAAVSVGLVQHHYGTKAQLRSAVDNQVLVVVAQATLSSPLPAPPEDPLAELGRRVVSIMRDEPDVVRYVGRLLVEGDDFANAIFDSLVSIASTIWDQFGELGLVPDDQDRTWAELLCIVLIVGSAILREPVERHLPEPFTTPSQLDRWDRAMYALLRNGLFREDADFSE